MKTPTPKPPRTPKSKRTEVTWASEDVTRRALEALHQRVTELEHLVQALIQPTPPPPTGSTFG